MNATTDSRPAVEIVRVRKDYGGAVGVADVSLTVGKGEFVTLLGPSGCGKSTLLGMIAGFVTPSAGKIIVDGVDLTEVEPYRRDIGMVFQSYALFPHMTVAQNIGFGLEMLGKPRAEIDARVAEMLKLVRMEKLAKRRTSQISGGQQQRVALARALAPQPKVLLLDEPLSALDYKLRKEMQIELKRLQHETGITFIFVTHDQEEALTMSDRIAVMSAGRILQVGSPRDIYDRPAERFVADFIGETNFLDARIDSLDGAKAKVTLKSGATIAATVAEGFKPDGDATVVIRPEHAKAVKGQGDISGIVETVVYFGTDTHVHIRLDDGETFTVRQQNARGAGAAFERGDRVGIVIGDDAAQILKD